MASQGLKDAQGVVSAEQDANALDAPAIAGAEPSASKQAPQSAGGSDAADAAQPCQGPASNTPAALGDPGDALSAIAQATLARFTIHLHSGDLAKQLTARRKHGGAFCAATVGNRHVHHLKAESKLAAALRPGAPVAVEGATNLVQLKAEQAAAVEGKVREWAREGGFVECGRIALPKGHLGFKRAA